MTKQHKSYGLPFLCLLMSMSFFAYAQNDHSEPQQEAEASVDPVLQSLSEEQRIAQPFLSAAHANNDNHTTTMKKIGVLGATGKLGKEILKQLQGQIVSVYVRNPDKLTDTQGVEVVQGQLTDAAALQKWASAQDVILCALGHTKFMAAFLATLSLRAYPQPDILTNATRLLLSSDCQRIVCCSAYGCHETRSDLPFFFSKVLLPLIIKQSYVDHENSESLFKASTSDWIVVRPSMLTDKPSTGIYRVAARFKKGEKLVIARADVADFMVKCIKDDTWLRKFPALAY